MYSKRDTTKGKVNYNHRIMELINQQIIENRIYTLRGIQVMPFFMK